MERNKTIKNFFKEYEELCKKYNVSLAHEDSHGGFIICEYDEDNIDWVKAATDAVKLKEEEMLMKLRWKEKYEKWNEELNELLEDGCYIVEVKKCEYTSKPVEGLPYSKVTMIPAVYHVMNKNGEFVREANVRESELKEYIDRYELYN